MVIIVQDRDNLPPGKFHRFCHLIYPLSLSLSLFKQKRRGELKSISLVEREAKCFGKGVGVTQVDGGGDHEGIWSVCLCPSAFLAGDLAPSGWDWQFFSGILITVAAPSRGHTGWNLFWLNLFSKSNRGASNSCVILGQLALASSSPARFCTAAS